MISTWTYSNGWVRLFNTFNKLCVTKNSSNSKPKFIISRIHCFFSDIPNGTTSQTWKKQHPAKTKATTGFPSEGNKSDFCISPNAYDRFLCQNGWLLVPPKILRFRSMLRLNLPRSLLTSVILPQVLCFQEPAKKIQTSSTYRIIPTIYPCDPLCITTKNIS